MSKNTKSKSSKGEDVTPKKDHPFSLSTTSVNKYDQYSIKAAIDEEIVEVSFLELTQYLKSS